MQNATGRLHSLFEKASSTHRPSARFAKNKHPEEQTPRPISTTCNSNQCTRNTSPALLPRDRTALLLWSVVCPESSVKVQFRSAYGLLIEIHGNRQTRHDSRRKINVMVNQLPSVDWLIWFPFDGNRRPCAFIHQRSTTTCSSWTDGQSFVNSEN